MASSTTEMAGEGHRDVEGQEAGDQRQRGRDQAGVAADAVAVAVLAGPAVLVVLVRF
jgi:hypothetical protein